MDKDITTRLKAGIAERIQLRLNRLGLKPAEACRRADMHKDTIRNVLRSLATPKNMPRLDTLAELAPALEVTPAWLAYGDTSGNIPDARSVRVTVDSTLQAGIWRSEAIEHPDIPPILMPRPNGMTATHDSTLYGGAVKGASMDRVFPPGTIVILRRTLDDFASVETGRIYHVERTDLEGKVEDTIKRVMRDAAGRLWLRPESNDPAFSAAIPVPTPSPEGIRFVGKVVSAIIQY